MAYGHIVMEATLALRACTGCGTLQEEEKYKMRGKNAELRFPNAPRHAMCNRCLYINYTQPSAMKKDKLVQEYKLENACADCGYRAHPAALEFDHRPGEKKLFTIMEKVGAYSMSKIWAEIAKCDVVCANCHAIRTANRRVLLEIAMSNSGNSNAGTAPPSDGHKECTSCGLIQEEHKFKLRYSQYGRDVRHSVCNRCLYIKYWRPRVRARTAEIHEYKLQQGCTDCGYSEHPEALDFDHMPESRKEFNIGAKIGVYSMERIWKEVAKCEVVCQNCHAIRTFTRRLQAKAI
jgi:hypothetical protein